MYRYCLTLTGNEADAGDLLQESYKNYLARKKTTATSPLRYFLRVIRNQHIDNLRTQSEDILDELDEDSVVHIDWRSLEDIVIERDEVEKLLRSVSPEEREILFLWAVEEFTAQDISEQLELPLGTVLSKLHRLRKKIRSQSDGSLSENAKSAR